MLYSPKFKILGIYYLDFANEIIKRDKLDNYNSLVEVNIIKILKLLFFKFHIENYLLFE